MSLLTAVVGARPQFIKLRPVVLAAKDAGMPLRIVHTGQHYDYEMSQLFFDELELPQPDENLGVGSAPPPQQVSDMITRLSADFSAYRPSIVLAFGDTNSTLATALAARLSDLPLAHVEAGARSFNEAMPEERNRIVTDHLAALNFAASQSAMGHLAREALAETSRFVGDTMLDVVQSIVGTLEERSDLLGELSLVPRTYAIATIHRAENTNSPDRLRSMLTYLRSFPTPVVLPLHPRTRAAIERFALNTELDGDQIRVISPLGYLAMMTTVYHAAAVLTDSGGLQKEAYYLGTPCITLRSETEWPETIDEGWNRLADLSKPAEIPSAPTTSEPRPGPFGSGDAGRRIVAECAHFISCR